MISECRKIIELGKRATPRPWVAYAEEPTGSNGWAGLAMIAGLPLKSIDRMTAFKEEDAALIVAACNTAPALAEAVLKITEIIPPEDVQLALDCATDGKWVHLSFDVAEARELLAALPRKDGP